MKTLNDSIIKKTFKTNLKLKEIQLQLDKTKQKKGLSVLEGILIGISALGIGLAI